MSEKSTCDLHEDLTDAIEYIHTVSLLMIFDSHQDELSPVGGLIQSLADQCGALNRELHDRAVADRKTE